MKRPLFTTHSIPKGYNQVLPYIFSLSFCFLFFSHWLFCFNLKCITLRKYDGLWIPFHSDFKKRSHAIHTRHSGIIQSFICTDLICCYSLCLFHPLSLTLTSNLTSSLLPPATHLQTAGNNYGLSGLCGLQMADKRRGEESGQSIRAELRMSKGNLMDGMGFQEAAAATRHAEGHDKMCHGARQINWESLLLWDLDSFLCENCLKTRIGNFAGTTSCHDSEWDKLCRPEGSFRLSFSTYHNLLSKPMVGMPYQHLTSTYLSRIVHPN